MSANSHGSRAAGLARRRRGYTLIEIVVVLGVLFILMGLLMPAIHGAREAARRTACLSNLKQITLATLAYSSTWGGFPPASSIRTVPGSHGVGGTHYSGQSLLLPFLDNVPLYHSINFELPGFTVSEITAENRTVTAVSVGVFLCPSDPSTSGRGTAPVNYRLNEGSDSGFDGYLDGAFRGNRITRPAEFSDGLSNTLCLSEKAIGTKSGSRGFSLWFEYPRGGGYPHSPEEWFSACGRPYLPTSIQDNGGATWLIGGARYTSFFVYAPPNSEIPDCGHPHFNGTGIFAARSYHPGGVCASRCDGSVAWYPNSIDADVWRSLGTIRGAAR